VTGLLNLTAQSPTFPELTNSFQFEEITEDEVTAALSRLHPTKVTGVDMVSARVLKTTAPAVSSSLYRLFNACLRTS